jgi:hypothetical protein
MWKDGERNGKKEKDWERKRKKVSEKCERKK